ncbi:spore germination protein GerPE [Aneurinibacillus sp. Ricciae_BoGa-3]|uniref:spore germination protein GerPE n=1 Tax=Aneurinibacillus sp. Ricciae_BoGa-3 TaxID=3022697 RepID=UPI00234124CD|nr:spore germination protein GerPE [Aneurinibacillus sp. Ricciae_BoGa-3]WCK55203.1 spore germination protein GerPE [Aneurinibacillus sp. Ricciae_BoGa-3]
MNRISAVKSIKIAVVAESAIVLVGDAVHVRPRSQEIEVQQGKATFIGNEPKFSDYPLFKRPIPQPIVDEDLHMSVKNKSPWINVKKVHIVDIAASAIFQVGSNKSVHTDDRKKTIHE